MVCTCIFKIFGTLQKKAILEHMKNCTIVGNLPPRGHMEGDMDEDGEGDQKQSLWLSTELIMANTPKTNLQMKHEALGRLT